MKLISFHESPNFAIYVGNLRITMKFPQLLAVQWCCWIKGEHCTSANPGLEGKQWQLRKNLTLALQHQATCEGCNFDDSMICWQKAWWCTMGHMQKCPICHKKKRPPKIVLIQKFIRKNAEKTDTVDRFDSAFPKSPTSFRKKNLRWQGTVTGHECWKYTVAQQHSAPPRSSAPRGNQLKET